MQARPKLLWTAVAVLPLFVSIMRRLAQPLLRRRPSRVPAVSTPYGCPLPPVIHRRIEQVKPGRLIVVGDVHGCPELFRLLDSLSYDPAADNLLLAGDLVNKGPASLAVLDALPGLQAHAVRGNHDDAVLAAWLRAQGSIQRDGSSGSVAGSSGGSGVGSGGGKAAGNALPAKFAWVAGMSEAQAARLAALPYTLSVPQYGIAVVHAGLVPGVPLEQQELWAMYKMRNVVPEEDQQEGRGKAEGQHVTEEPRGGVTGVGPTPGSAEAPTRHARLRAVEKVKDGGEPWAALWRGPPHVFFGHDARRGLQLHPAATGLDTGAVYGGALTAAVMPPLAELTVAVPGGGGAGFAAAMAAGRAVSREELRVQLVSVPAAEVYSPPSAPAGGDGAGGATAQAPPAAAAAGA